jgi:thiol-disulfide isomerase/thioredoxin
LVGPFSGRQLLGAFVAIAAAVVVLVAVTTPLGSTGSSGLGDPRATPFVIGPAPAEGLRPGDRAPEFTVQLPEGNTYQLADLNGNPIRLADLRGKAVWINFWATWCPPCQAETPVLRELAEEYRDDGLELVAITVQETTPVEVGRYAERYQLGYTIGFDGSGHIFDLYKGYVLPTQVFIGPDGVIRDVVLGQLDVAGARARIERILPATASPEPSS